MAEEDQTPRCSHSSSGGGGHFVRSSKKTKPKKLPQRGLGVAQLERIRLEEQQKKDASSSSVLPSSASKSSNHQPCSSPTPFQAAAGHLSSSPNSIFRPPSSAVVQNIEILNSNSSTVPLTNPVGWGHAGNVLKLYNSCDFNLEKESPGVGPGSTFQLNLNNLPYESIPVWPLPNSIHRAPQLQHPSSSMVYESSPTSSSSVLNFQMEPPSNQSYYSNYPPTWPEEEKMAGMKRPYPFSLDHQPGFSSLHHKIPPIVHPIIARSEDSASCCIGHRLIFEPGNTISREGSSCSTYMLEHKKSKKSTKGNGVSEGGFLKLAPPTTTSLCQGSKFKHTHFLAFNSAEFPDFESLPYQGSVEDKIHLPGPNQRQPYYSFFPKPMAQIGQATGIMNNCDNGEVSESVDLNLKL